MRQQLWGGAFWGAGNFFWGAGYFARTVGDQLTAAVIMRYIQNHCLETTGN